MDCFQIGFFEKVGHRLVVSADIVQIGATVSPIGSFESELMAANLAVKITPGVLDKTFDHCSERFLTSLHGVLVTSLFVFCFSEICLTFVRHFAVFPFRSIPRV